MFIYLFYTSIWRRYHSYVYLFGPGYCCRWKHKCLERWTHATYVGSYTGAVPNDGGKGGGVGNNTKCFQMLTNNDTMAWWRITKASTNMSAYAGGTLKFFINTSTSQIKIQIGDSIATNGLMLFGYQVIVGLRVM